MGKRSADVRIKRPAVVLLEGMRQQMKERRKLSRRKASFSSLGIFPGPRAAQGEL